MYENKKILILGMARSGYAASILLSNKNNEIIVTDSKDQDETKIKELETLNIKFLKTSTPEDILDESFDLIIKNPAVFPSHPCIIKGNNLDIPVVNEMEVAYHFLPQNVKIIGVTGSNGKTTTTTLIYETLKKAHEEVTLGGNIGTPLSELINKNLIKPNSYLLLEISDHQLMDFHDFKTDISILTNLCPTHLDYHGSYETYKNVKKKIFNHHDNKDIAILNTKNPDSIDLTKDIQSTKYYFNDAYNYYTDTAIFINKEEVLKTKDIILKGEHNYENILALLVLLKNLNIAFKYAQEVLKTFKGVEHRLEFVKEINGVKYYNDSKSTNPTSTITALKSFKSNIHLILGGMNRNQEFTDLIPYLNRVTKIYAIGEVRELIYKFCATNKVPCEKYEFLKDALKSAHHNAQKGDIVLLSPGSASWDQYAKFEDRGTEFKDIINTCF